MPDLYLIVYLMTNQNSNSSQSYSNQLPVESLLTVELTGGQCYARPSSCIIII